jgi:hypothetical protein
MNRVSSPYTRPHTLAPFATQVKDCYSLLTRTLPSYNQGFAVHAILYTILPLKIRKNTEKVGVFCAKISRFAGVIVVVAAKLDSVPSRQP